MTTRECESAADIPRFAKPLTPYLRSRQETLRIRQALTLYLSSQIVYTDHVSTENEPSTVPSHLSLCAPHHHAVAEVKRTPADMTGLRREYLEALRENLAARKSLDSVVSNVNARRSQKSLERRDDAGATDVVNGELQSYLQLLRDRRRHAKCQVLEHYFDELRSRDVAKPEYFDRAASWDGQRFSLGEGIGGRGQMNDGTHTDVDTLVHSLEKAVIRAKAQLDREKRLFEELKAKHHTESRPPSAVPPSAKITALQRTRDELVDWVEDKLMSVGSDEAAPPPSLESGELDSSAQYLEEKKEQIKQQYAAYVSARKRLLEAIATACQPVTVPPPPKRHIQQSAVQADTGTDAPRPVEALHALQYASEILLPLSKSQRSLTLHKSYLAGMLAKEKSTTLRMLDRVRDESHLIPEYPLLMRQPRFQRAVAALGSRSHPGTAEKVPQDEILNLADSWAFASDAARTHEHEYVEERLQAGTEIVQDTRRTLEEVYGVLNQDLDEVIGDDGNRDDARDADESDLWASEILSKRRSMTATKDRRSKGPWYGLHGRVGVLGET